MPKVGNLMQECMQEIYDTPLSGRLGVTKTQKAVMQLFWWPSVDRMSSSMCLHVTAVKGQRAVNQKHAGFLVPLDVPLRRRSRIRVDLITQLPGTVNGNACIVVFVDRLSIMVQIAPAPTNTGA